jgi:DNA-binding IclR family transcriptional regulator
VSVSKSVGSKREYQAPALDKGLEIVEFLADKAAAYGMMEIANALGRSRNEIYRMLVVLERRGYLRRLADDRFELSNRLFELGMRSPPLRNLHDAALPHMHRLAEALFQSCHLVVRSDKDIVVVARVESPDLLGFAVRVGYRRPIVLSTSGRLLHAFLPPERQQASLEALRAAAPGETEVERFIADCAKILKKGYHVGPSVFVDAVTDLGVPIFDGATEGAVAALVVPFVSGRSARSTIDEALDQLRAAAETITDILRHG